MILQEWLDKLNELDPSDVGEIEEVRASFSPEELQTETEAEITLRTLAGVVDQITIQLIDDDDNVLVNLDYESLELDLNVLAALLLKTDLPPEPEDGRPQS